VGSHRRIKMERLTEETFGSVASIVVDETYSATGNIDYVCPLCERVVLEGFTCENAGKLAATAFRCIGCGSFMCVPRTDKRTVTRRLAV
jgi:hypothetical protein